MLARFFCANQTDLLRALKVSARLANQTGMSSEIEGIKERIKILSEALSIISTIEASFYNEKEKNNIFCGWRHSSFQFRLKPDTKNIYHNTQVLKAGSYKWKYDLCKGQKYNKSSSQAETSPITKKPG